jgi:hypothetical protein
MEGIIRAGSTLQKLLKTTRRLLFIFRIFDINQTQAVSIISLPPWPKRSRALAGSHQVFGMHFRVALLLLLAAALSVLSGCSPRYFSVRGKATVDGKPLTTGAIKFTPDKDNPLKTIHKADVDSEGNYEIIFPEKEGVPLGWYKVTAAFDKKELGGASLPVHTRFTSATSTPISIEIVATPQPGAYDLEFSEK